MKLRTITSAAATAATIAGAIAFAGIATSCAMPSIYAVAPKAPTKKLDWVKGDWTFKPDSATVPAYTATVTAVGGDRWIIDWKPPAGVEAKPDMPALRLIARPFELGGKLFADVKIDQSIVQDVAKKYPAFFVPTHVLARIDRDTTTGEVTISLPSYPNALQLAAEQKRDFPVLMSESDSDVVLATTAESEAITKFYEDNAKNEKLFALKLKFVKASP